MNIKVKLCSIQEDLFNFWKNEFKDYKEVDIILGDIFNQKADAIVSPSNSFGFMDAGLDLMICKKMGLNLEKKVQRRIRKDFYGELPVGNAMIMYAYKKFKYLIVSPTMRVPMKLEKSINPYLSTRAVFLAIEEFNKDEFHESIESIVIPGMGTGYGNVPVRIAAKQMRVAYEQAVLKKIPYPKDWKEASNFHKYMIGKNNYESK